MSTFERTLKYHLVSYRILMGSGQSSARCSDDRKCMPKSLLTSAVDLGRDYCAHSGSGLLLVFVRQIKLTVDMEQTSMCSCREASTARSGSTVSHVRRRCTSTSKSAVITTAPHHSVTDSRRRQPRPTTPRRTPSSTRSWRRRSVTGRARSPETSSVTKQPRSLLTGKPRRSVSIVVR